MKLYIKSFNEAITAQDHTKMYFYIFSRNACLRHISSFIDKISNYHNNGKSLSDIKSRSKYNNMYIQALIRSEGIKRISEVSNNEKDQ